MVLFYSTSEPPPEGETAIFLHGQEKIWKGLINMQGVAKFVTKAYLVSGSFEHLKEVSHFSVVVRLILDFKLIFIKKRKYFGQAKASYLMLSMLCRICQTPFMLGDVYLQAQFGTMLGN